MATLMIGYDLNRPHQNYQGLIDAIKSKFPNWWHCLDSTWLIKTEMSCSSVRDLLAPYIDRNDEILVARLSGDAAWVGFDQNCSDWLKNNL